MLCVIWFYDAAPWLWSTGMNGLLQSVVCPDAVKPKCVALRNQSAKASTFSFCCWPLVFPDCRVKVCRWTTLMMSIHHCWRSFGFLHSGALKGKVGSRGAPLLWWISLTIVGILQGKQSFCGGQASTWILWIYLLLPTCVWLKWRRSKWNLAKHMTKTHDLIGGFCDWLASDHLDGRPGQRNRIFNIQTLFSCH